MNDTQLLIVARLRQIHLLASNIAANTSRVLNPDMDFPDELTKQDIVSKAETIHYLTTELLENLNADQKTE